MMRNMNMMVCQVGVAVGTTAIGDIIVVPFTMTNDIDSADVW